MGHKTRWTGAEVLDPEQVIERLERLPDVLASNNPTLGNLELSLHIDRIDCHKDGRVVMRTCKLGALAGAVDLLDRDSEGVSRREEPKCDGADRATPRRRARLRVDGGPESGADLKATANTAADPNRFAGLGEEWFWADEFRIPVRISWAEEHANAVLQRYEEIRRGTGKKPSLNALAREFGKSRPTITAALDIARNGRARKSLVGRKRRERAPKDTSEIEDEVFHMHYHGKLPINEIAKRKSIHRNTVVWQPPRSTRKTICARTIDLPWACTPRESMFGEPWTDREWQEYVTVCREKFRLFNPVRGDPPNTTSEELQQRFTDIVRNRQNLRHLVNTPLYARMLVEAWRRVVKDAEDMDEVGLYRQYSDYVLSGRKDIGGLPTDIDMRRQCVESMALHLFKEQRSVCSDRDLADIANLYNRQASEHQIVNFVAVQRGQGPSSLKRRKFLQHNADGVFGKDSPGPASLCPSIGW